MHNCILVTATIAEHTGICLILRLMQAGWNVICLFIPPEHWVLKLDCLMLLSGHPVELFEPPNTSLGWQVAVSVTESVLCMHHYQKQQWQQQQQWLLRLVMVMHLLSIDNYINWHCNWLFHAKHILFSLFVFS